MECSSCYILEWLIITRSVVSRCWNLLFGNLKMFNQFEKGQNLGRFSFECSTSMCRNSEKVGCVEPLFILLNVFKTPIIALTNIKIKNNHCLPYYFVFGFFLIKEFTISISTINHDQKYHTGIIYFKHPFFYNYNTLIKIEK